MITKKTLYQIRKEKTEQKAVSHFIKQIGARQCAEGVDVIKLPKEAVSVIFSMSLSMPEPGKVMLYGKKVDFY